MSREKWKLGLDVQSTGIPMSLTSANIFKFQWYFSRGVPDFSTPIGFFMVIGGLAGLLGAFY